MIVITVIFLITLVSDAQYPITPNAVIGYLSSCSDLILFGVGMTTSIALIYRSQTNTESLSLIYVLLMVFLLGYIAIIFDSGKPGRRLDVRTWQSESQWPMLQAIFTAIVLADRAENHSTHNQLHVVFMLLSHIHKQTQCFGPKAEDLFDQILSMRYVAANSLKTDKQQTTLKDLCFKVLKEVCVALIARFPKEMYVRLLHAYIMFGRLNSKWRAVYELETVLSSECPMAIKVSAVRLMSMIEHETKEFEFYSTQNLGVDASKILYRQKHYEELKQIFKSSCETHKLFWEELSEKKPSAEKLQKLGYEIARSNDQISHMLKDSNNGESNQGLKVLQMYGEFLKLVANESEDSKRILQRVNNVTQNMAMSMQIENENRIQNLETSNPCIIVASGDFKTMGVILEVNMETQKLLQRMRSELLGENVNMIMPKIYSDYHDFWMKRYFDTNTERIMNRERPVYAYTRNGFVIKVNLLIKIIPEISEGIKIVGVFTEIRSMKEDAVMLINLDNGHLVGVTEECYKNFGIHPGLCYGVAQTSGILNVLHVFPHVSDPIDLSLERQRASFELQEMNTTELGSYILASRLESDDLGIPPPKQSLFKRHTVRLIPKPVQYYENTDLRVLELEIEDAFFQAERRGSRTGSGILAVGAGNKKMVEQIMERIAPNKDKTYRPAHYDRLDNDDDEIIDVNKDFTEAQIEEMNVRAERERKLKEHRQLLKTRNTPFQIILIYLVSLVALITAFAGHSTSLVLKDNVIQYFDQNIQAVSVISKRVSMITAVSFYIAKLKYHTE